MKNLSLFITEKLHKNSKEDKKPEYQDDIKDDINAFVILKPEFISHKNEFENMLKDDGWQIVQHKKEKLSLETAQELYEMHKGKDFYDSLCKYMSSSECICYTCKKDVKNPIKNMDKFKDEVRKMWGKSEMKNAMHSSDSLKNVKRESKIIFNDKK